MPQSVKQTIRNTFNKGLLTEFSELNFPQEASVDELNCDLFRAGYRTKRFGIKEQVNTTPLDIEATEGTLFHIQRWTNVGEDASVNYVIVQEGRILRFFKIGYVPLVDGIVPVSNSDDTVYELDMGDYAITSGLGAGASRISCASINGYLVVVSPQIEPFKIERDKDTGEFNHEQIDFYIRDYDWQGDRTDYDERASNPSVGRKYDTKNCGWADGESNKADKALSYYISKRNGAWPPLTHPWFSAKHSDGDFGVGPFEDIYAGSGLIGNGHYILNLFNKDRSSVSGVSGIPVETLAKRFSAVVAYAGRVWYAGADSKVYYSQILESSNQLGSCYSSQDPTSEYSGSLETDGGYISVSGAEGINGLTVFGSSLLVFANNGVWRVSGTDYNLFKATDYSVYKITDYGLAYRASLISGQNGVPFWWSYSGIHTIEVTSEGGMVEQSISRDTIKTFWEDIGETARGYVTSAFDKENNRVAWMYPDTDEDTPYKLNNILFLDADLGAFFPWRIEDATEDTPYILGATYLDGQGNETTSFDVVDSLGNYVIDSSGNQVTVSRDVGTLKSSELVFLTYDNGSIYFSSFTDNTYKDWEDNYFDAYAESSYNFIGDLGRRKNTPYITVLLRQTESGWSEEEGTYTLIDESSLKVSAFWDFKTTSSTAEQQAYRLKNPSFADPSDLDTFLYPTTVITTRLRLRGRGRVVKLRFQGEEGKGFTLLGWETVDAINPGY